MQGGRRRLCKTIGSAAGPVKVLSYKIYGTFDLLFAVKVLSWRDIDGKLFFF